MLTRRKRCTSASKGARDDARRLARPTHVIDGKDVAVGATASASPIDNQIPSAVSRNASDGEVDAALAAAHGHLRHGATPARTRVALMRKVARIGGAWYESQPPWARGRQESGEALGEGGVRGSSSLCEDCESTRLRVRVAERTATVSSRARSVCGDYACGRNRAVHFPIALAAARPRPRVERQHWASEVVRHALGGRLLTTAQRRRLTPGAFNT